MIRLKSLLLKESRSKSLSFEKFKDLYKKNCKEHTPQSQEIYRGTESGYKYGFINPSNYTRTSTGDVKNHYTLLIDNLPGWSEYPKRSKSVICTMDSSVAKGYGNLYVVIPFDDEKIGIAPEGDVWNSFQKGIEKNLDFLNLHSDSLPNVNTMLDLFYVFLKEGEVDGLDDSEFSILWKQIGEISNNFDEVYRNMKRFQSDMEYRLDFDLDRYYKQVFKSGLESAEVIKENDINLKEKIRKAFDPDLNGFKLKRYNKPFYTNKDNNEVWTSGRCLLIAQEHYKSFIQKVRG